MDLKISPFLNMKFNLIEAFEDILTFTNFEV